MRCGSVKIHRLTFHFVFIPWLQRELDAYVERHNSLHMPRFNKNKVLPRGRPDDIWHHPERFGTKNFAVSHVLCLNNGPYSPASLQVHVRQEFLDEMRNKYAPPDHHCFELVPPEFAATVAELYGPQGMPKISMNNAWQEYARVLAFVSGKQIFIPPEFGLRDPLEMPPEEFVPILDLPRPQSGMDRMEIIEEFEVPVDNEDIPELEGMGEDDDENRDSIMEYDDGPRVPLTGYSVVNSLDSV